MDFNRFTEKLQDAFRAAQSKAARSQHQQIDVEHLLLALLEQENGLASNLFLKADIKLETFHSRLVQELDKLPRVSGPGASPDQVYVTNRLQKVLLKAEDEAKRLKDDYVSIEHVILAMLDDSGAAGKL